MGEASIWQILNNTKVPLYIYFRLKIIIARTPAPPTHRRRKHTPAARPPTAGHSVHSQTERLARYVHEGGLRAMLLGIELFLSPTLTSCSAISNVLNVIDNIRRRLQLDYAVFVQRVLADKDRDEQK